MDLAIVINDIARARKAWYQGKPGAAVLVRDTAERVFNLRDFRGWPAAMVEDVAGIFHTASVAALHQRRRGEAVMWANYTSQLGRERIRYDVNAAGLIALGDCYPDTPLYRLTVLNAAKPVSAQMRAYHAAHRADANAMAGNRTEALDALDALDAALDDARREGWSPIWRIEVNTAVGLSVRGGVCMRLGLLDDAEQALRARLATDWPGRPGNESRLHLARVLARRGELDEAAKLGELAALRLLPNSPRAIEPLTELRDALASRGVKIDGLTEMLELARAHQALLPPPTAGRAAEPGSS